MHPKAAANPSDQRYRRVTMILRLVSDGGGLRITEQRYLFLPLLVKCLSHNIYRDAYQGI